VREKTRYGRVVVVVKRVDAAGGDGGGGFGLDSCVVKTGSLEFRQL